MLSTNVVSLILLFAILRTFKLVKFIIIYNKFLDITPKIMMHEGKTFSQIFEEYFKSSDKEQQKEFLKVVLESLTETK